MSITSRLARLATQVVDRLQPQANLRRECDRLQREMAQLTPGNPAIHGYKVYSQCDEDGILAWLFAKIPSEHVFVEIGCGNGLENNTHALVLSGWRGVWIDGNPKNIDAIGRAIPQSGTLRFACEIIREDNIREIVTALLSDVGATQPDLLSIDIDSNDVDVLATALQHFTPKVVCVEYNPKFPPPMDVRVRTGTSGWHGDDYHGASLSCFVNLLAPNGYRLVTCNLSGVNAFFVHNDFADRFPQYAVEQLYQPARFYLARLAAEHPASMKFLSDKLRAPLSGAGT